MLDSLLGTVILLLLTSWMVSVVSIQSRLLASVDRFSGREQIDYLRAAKRNHDLNPTAYTNSSVGSVSPCATSAASGRFLEHLRSFQASTPAANHLDQLRRLLIDPQVMNRPDGQTPQQLITSLRAEDLLPFTTAANALNVEGFLPSTDPAEPGHLRAPTAPLPDWTFTQSDKQRLPLRLCAPPPA
ncbi:MAG: hypothetical protein VKM98_02110 [Cyanobacteriota bacterium]|nr:hypothetical protein [Cyanobacteriota bacterium]